MCDVWSHHGHSAPAEARTLIIIPSVHANALMSLISITSPALAALVVSSRLFVTAGDEVPTYNLSPSCRSETVSAASDRNCPLEEQQARDTLLHQWPEFTPVDRANCQQVEQTAGAPSYVELLTCLQMAAAAKKLPNPLALTFSIAELKKFVRDNLWTGSRPAEYDWRLG